MQGLMGRLGKWGWRCMQGEEGMENIRQGASHCKYKMNW